MALSILLAFYKEETAREADYRPHTKGPMVHNQMFRRGSKRMQPLPVKKNRL